MLTRDTAKAVRVTSSVHSHTALPSSPTELSCAGVNASDVNYTSGFYHGPKRAQSLLPLAAGFEAVGVVAALGSGVSGADLIAVQLHRLLCYFMHISLVY